MTNEEFPNDEESGFGGLVDRAEGKLLLFGGGSLGLLGVGELHLAELVGVREVVDAADAEVLEEEVGRFVKQGATGKFGTAPDLHEVAVEELLDHPVAGDATDGLDGGLGDRLTVGDDGEGFHGRTA